MNNTMIKHTRPNQCLLPPRGAILTLLSLWLVFMASMLEAVGQEGVSATVTNVPNQTANGTNTQTSGEPKTNEVPKVVVLSQRLGGPVWEALLQNQFVVWENGILRRDRVAVGDLKKLLKYEDKDLNPVPSSGLGHPAYYLPFSDVRCIIKVAEERKSIHDDATLVNVTISTNVLAVGHNPAAKKWASQRKDKPSGDGEKK